MRQVERLRVIERMASETGWVGVDDLTQALATSAATVRRDLDLLSKSGAIERVRGGAEPKRRPRLSTPAFAASLERCWPAKRAIARRAAQWCERGGAYAVHGGSTTFAMAEWIRHLGLDVLTNSIPLANHLIQEGDCRVCMPGGEAYRAQAMIVSPWEEDTVMDRFFARAFFCGAHAIGKQGIMEGDLRLIETERKMRKRADELIILADGSKFGPNGALVMCGLGEVDRVITDDSAPRDAVAMLRDHGVAVDVVGVDATDLGAAEARA